ncbi:MAG: hypothetical protein EBU06_05225 [Micrococcales bacterium]|nr:hypothetical protein [Micrococcales bacterium]
MRIRAIGQGAIQAAYVATVGFVFIFLLNLITWLVEQTTGQTFNSVLQTSSRIWLNAHFVPINIAAGRVAGITVPAYEFYLSGTTWFCWFAGLDYVPCWKKAQ